METITRDLEKSNRKRKKKEKKAKKARKKEKREENVENNDHDSKSSEFVPDDAVNISVIRDFSDDNANRDAVDIEQKAAISTSGSVKEFFANLIATETGKPIIGTIHHKDKKDTLSAPLQQKSTEWVCSKCNTPNIRQATQCQKCRALKKITEWR